MLTRRSGILAGVAGLFGGKPSQSAPAQVAPAGRESGVSIFTEEFRLVLTGDWREIPSSDPNQIMCESENLKTSIVASVLYANLPRQKLIEAAEQLFASREAGERAARPSVVFFDTYVGFKEADQAGHVAYGGRDSNTIFRFFGWTTERKILSLWISTETQDDDVAERITQGIMGQGFAMIFP